MGEIDAIGEDASQDTTTARKDSDVSLGGVLRAEETS
jgi:hypothetical protein